MHGENNNNDSGVIASINIIPFVDIVLVLLIIFMVTSTAIVRAAIKVDLPTAASAGDSVTTTVNLIVTAKGELLLDGQQLPAVDIAKQIRVAVEKDKDTQAVISADKRLAYGEVVKVIDMVKSSGVRSFALNIEREVASK
ncbi:MAG: biopolymer transporter ExbD [Myxococcota bacterium]|jgi:biopolymer transport protein ExbD|nr:biopolymer transporter ExbD [Myxococcota bacterium]